MLQVYVSFIIFFRPLSDNAMLGRYRYIWLYRYFRLQNVARFRLFS